MKRLIIVLSIVTVLFLVSCGASTPTPSPELERVPSEPTATLLPSTDYRLLGITTSDELTLSSAFYPPAGSTPRPGVLLLHQLDGRREDWSPLADRLQEEGYGVLSLDLRGHGESEGEFEPVDPDLLVDDALRAWAVLAAQPEVDPDRTAIIGASVGANLALRAAAVQPEVQVVALLSPGLDYQGVETAEAMVELGDRSVLIVASEEDDYAAESAEELTALAVGMPISAFYSDAGHGTMMLASRPDLLPLILGWLDSQVGP